MFNGSNKPPFIEWNLIVTFNAKITLRNRLAIEAEKIRMLRAGSSVTFVFLFLFQNLESTLGNEPHPRFHHKRSIGADEVLQVKTAFPDF